MPSSARNDRTCWSPLPEPARPLVVVRLHRGEVAHEMDRGEAGEADVPGHGLLVVVAHGTPPGSDP